MFCGCLGLLAQVKFAQEAIYFIAVHWLTKTDAGHGSAATPFGLSLSRPACTVMALDKLRVNGGVTCMGV